MKATRVILFAYALMLVVFCDIKLASASVTKWNGTTLSMSAHTLELRLTSPGDRVPFSIPLEFSWGGANVLVDDLGDAGRIVSPGTLNDLKSGDAVSVTADGVFITEIRIHKQLNESGVVGRLPAGKLEIEALDPSSKSLVSRSFFLDDRTHVNKFLFDRGPIFQLQPRDIRVGDRVSVLNARGRAFAVTVSAPPPVTGSVVSISSQLIILNSAHSSAQPIKTEQIAIAPTTRFFQMFFGEPPEEVSISELDKGVSVGVTVDGASAIAVVADYPAVGGIVVKVDDGTLTIKSADKDGAIVLNQFVIRAGSKIMLGVVRSREMTNRGVKTTRDFKPGAKLADVHVGDLVNITAKRGVVRSMLVTPAKPQALAAMETHAISVKATNVH